MSPRPKCMTITEAMIYVSDDGKHFALVCKWKDKNKGGDIFTAEAPDEVEFASSKCQDEVLDAAKKWVEEQ